MSRFRFNFGQDDKKRSQRDPDHVVMSTGQGRRYDHDQMMENDYAQQGGSRPGAYPTYNEPSLQQRGAASTQHQYDDNDYGQQSSSGHAFRRPTTQPSGRDPQIGQYEQRPENFLSPQRQQRQSHQQEQEHAPQLQRPFRTQDANDFRFWNENDDHFDDENEGNERPSILRIVIAITGIAFIGTISWLAYRWMTIPAYDEPPLIQSPTDPYRVRPQSPGGTEFPHQDKLIYERLAPTNEQPVERLLPQPEQHQFAQPPVIQQQQLLNAPSLPQQQAAHAHIQEYAQGQPQQYPVQNTNNPTYNPQQVMPQQIQQQPTQAQTYQAQQMPLPQLQQGLQINQPNSGINQQNQQYAPAPLQSPSQQQNPAVAFQNNVPVDEFDDPEQMPMEGVQIQQQMGQQLVQQPMPQQGIPQQQNMQQSAPAANAPTASQQNKLNDFVNNQTPAVKTDGIPHYLQLGTLITKELAEKEKSRLEKRYAKELDGNEIMVKPYNAPDGSKKFRLVTNGTYDSKTTALDKCAKLGNACKPVKG